MSNNAIYKIVSGDIFDDAYPVGITADSTIEGEAWFAIPTDGPYERPEDAYFYDGEFFVDGKPYAFTDDQKKVIFEAFERELKKDAEF